MVDVELHPHGIAPISFKNITNLFICIKRIFFLYLIFFLGGYNRNKTRPRRPRIHFKKVGALPSEPIRTYLATTPAPVLLLPGNPVIPDNPVPKNDDRRRGFSNSGVGLSKYIKLF